jgi:hypothetical protein
MRSREINGKEKIKRKKRSKEKGKTCEINRQKNYKKQIADRKSKRLI